jgi:hypothetical protein
VVRVFGSAERTQSGRALGPAGDFDGDGFEDFVVGAQNSLPFEPGSISVVFGGSELPGRIELGHLGRFGTKIHGIQPITRLDVSGRQTGDLNGDGLQDFAFSERGSPDFPSPEGVPSPGAVHVIYGLPSDVPFFRGDSTFDEELNISDAVFTLSFLFLGGPAPLCEDAADTDDTGDIILTDAVYLLNFLFTGGPPPPPPHAEKGLDETPDNLDCRGF